MTTSEWVAQQQVYAAWIQAGSLIVAALVALAIYGLHVHKENKLEKRQDRRFMETILAFAKQVRQLFYEGAEVYSFHEFGPSSYFVVLLKREGHELRTALSSLPLERAPDSGLLEPVLTLRACLRDVDEILAAPEDAAAIFKELHHQADAAVAKIDSLIKLGFGKPRMPLRIKAPAGMPTTAVDQYASFKFTEDIYLEADGVDFEVLVNNQSVRCTVPHEVLDRLAVTQDPQESDAIKDYEAIFKQHREGIQRIAEKLIRAGARSPVEVRCKEIEMAVAQRRLTFQ